MVVKYKIFISYLAKIAMFIFGVALWHRGSVDQVAYNLLLAVWLLDGGFWKLWLRRKEPMVLGIVVLVLIFAFGLLWADGGNGKSVFTRYSILLVFIPYWLLLTRDRLVWALSGLAIGFLLLLAPALYAAVMDIDWLPLWNSTYITASMIIGFFVVFLSYGLFTADTKPRLWRISGASLIVVLLLLQSTFSARGALLFTLITLFVAIVVFNWNNKRRIFSFVAYIAILAGIIVVSSDTVQHRIIKAQMDLDSASKGKYDTSLGYRLAMWDIGLVSLSEKPFFGQGTGAAANYFDAKTQVYKAKEYSKLPKWLHTGATYHYHNDIIEIGVHTGLAGILAFFAFLAGWFKTLQIRKRSKEAVVLITFFVLLGLTDVLFIYRWAIYLFMVVTALLIFTSDTKEGKNV